VTADDPSDQSPAESASGVPPRAESDAAIAPAEGAAPGQPARHRRRRRRRRPANAAPRAEGATATPAEGATAASAGVESTPGETPTVETAPGGNTLRLRTRPPRRRRRRPPIAAAAGGETGAASGEAGAAASGDAGAAPQAAPRLGPDGQPLRHRRRRRRPPQFGGAGEAASGQPLADGAAPTPRPPRDPNRPPRQRDRRPRGDRPAAAGAPGAAREARPEGEHRGGPGRGPREARAGGPRDRERNRDGRPGRRDGRDGRGRGDGPKRIERKLYSFDSVVDRGFEDVEEESGTRRVHWTIVKRTVADQISRKPMSHSYVVQRDGADSEFPTLGAARDTVNKKIVHPEKLTLSKAEHAAQKGNSR
jgi:hypothetical protein